MTQENKSDAVNEIREKIIKGIATDTGFASWKGGNRIFDEEEDIINNAISLTVEKIKEEIDRLDQIKYDDSHLGANVWAYFYVVRKADVDRIFAKFGVSEKEDVPKTLERFNENTPENNNLTSSENTSGQENER